MISSLIPVPTALEAGIYGILGLVAYVNIPREFVYHTY